MSWSELFSKLKRYDQNATVIFDRAEPIGQPTDLVLPYRRWFKRRAPHKKATQPLAPAAHS
ncbi:MAG: hypothetical protein M3Q46_06885 [Verrucomicrobiota bacterium]|nr:hypothetical protein [Verrucomicrobiota bacterium]